MPSTKPLASLSLDLDNKWSYMKTHGDAGWECFPSYLDVVVPRVLRMLDDLDLKITFFIVGQDAAIEGNRAVLRLITAAGHEIGNHSFQHEPWLHLYSREELEKEFDKAEVSFEKVFGTRPLGFRGPGFSFSNDVLQLLVRRGYKYDASTFPTFLGPLARLYYFASSRLSKGNREQRKELFGSFKEVFRRNKAHFWRELDGPLLEIPVTTMPLFRVPAHLSYILYIGSYSPALALVYFRVFLFLCRLTGTQPSLLLHPLDFIGHEDAPELEFFPAMKMRTGKKIQVAKQALSLYANTFSVLRMSDHAAALAANMEPRKQAAAATVAALTSHDQRKS